MSVLGQKRTSRHLHGMSALPPKADMPGYFDSRLICCSTTTGSVNVNVEPWPGCDSTQILPPCISMMRLDMEPQAGAALLARDGIVGLLKLLKQLSLVRSRDAGSGVADRHMERAIVRISLDGDFACI